MRSHSSMELVDAERAALPRSHTSLGFADAAPEMAQEDEMVAIVTLARRCVQMERRCHGKVRSRWIQSIAKEGRVPQSYSTHEAGRALRCRISHLEAEICRANKLARFQQMKQERSVSPIGRLAALTRPTSAGCDSRPQHPPTSWASANLACNATARARNIIMSRTHSWPAAERPRPGSSDSHADGNFEFRPFGRLESRAARRLSQALAVNNDPGKEAGSLEGRHASATERQEARVGTAYIRIADPHNDPAHGSADSSMPQEVHSCPQSRQGHEWQSKLSASSAAVFRNETSTAFGAEAAKSFGKHCETAPADREEEDLEKMFRLIKQKTIRSKMENKWGNITTAQTLTSANGLIDQLNYFLVAHLKAVPPEKLQKRILETFCTFDDDNSGELSKAEVAKAFERLGKPLAPSDIDAYMQTVDVDGSGFVDLDEFAHMTRRLLGVDCEVTCKSCRHLRSNGQEHNWGQNEADAVKLLEPAPEANINDENVLSQEVQIVTQDEKKNKKGKTKGTSRQVDRERVKNSQLTSSRANMRRNGSQHSLGSLSRTGSQTDVSASRTDSSAESPMTDSHEYTKVPHKASRNGIHHSLQSTSKILASKLRTQHSNRTNRVKMQTGSDGQMNHTQAVGRRT